MVLFLVQRSVCRLEFNCIPFFILTLNQFIQTENRHVPFESAFVNINFMKNPLLLQ